MRHQQRGTRLQALVDCGASSAVVCMYVNSSQNVIIKPALELIIYDRQLKLRMCARLERSIIARQVTAADAALPARVPVAGPPRERSV